MTMTQSDPTPARAQPTDQTGSSHCEVKPPSGKSPHFSAVTSHSTQSRCEQFEPMILAHESDMKERVLVIDASEEVHGFLEGPLKRAGVDLTHAETGLGGYAQAVGTQPDLILLNVSMPDISGFDVCRQLKAARETEDIPVIFLSSASDVEQKVQGFELGAVDYIEKPFEPAELNVRIRAALRTSRLQNSLARRAKLDGLTGLWNRAYFDDRLHEEVSAAARYDRPLSLVMMDVDRFKTLNDTCGHRFGDEVLQTIGDVLQDAVRTSDCACRYGGEEFGLILRETDIEGGLLMAERVRSRIERLQLRHEMKDVPVTASFGVSSSTLCLDAAELSPFWMIDTADRALYAAKEDGRNRVRAAKRQ